MTHRGTPSENPAERSGQIRLDGLLYPAEINILYTPTARFTGRITFGDASFDSDAVISVDIATDHSGGGQIEHRNEGSDQGRFWWSTLHTRDPFALTLAREVVTVSAASNQSLLLALHWAVSGANDEAWPLADLNDVFWLDVGLSVRSWGEATDALGAVVATLDDHPVNRPMAFGVTGAGSAPVLWIPQGVAGYQTFNGTTVAAQVTTITPVAFCEFDDLLWAMGTDGRLSYWDGATWNDRAQLDWRHTPINLLRMDVADDAPALHVVSNYGVLAFDETQDVFYATKLGFEVAHPDAGLASATWAGGGGQPGLADGTGAAGGDLYWATAMQVYRYTLGSTISPIGPQRDQGLPSQVRGRIRSLLPEQNGLYALVEGDTVTSDAEPSYAFSEMGWNADPFLVSATTAYSTLMIWTGIGWHTAWVSPDATGTPTLLTLSGAAGAYRLWWGYGASLYTIALPRDFHLPRQGLEAGIDRFQSTGYLETGWFDAQMAGYFKQASHFQVELDRCTAATGTVTVKYQVDFDDDWVQLGSTLAQRGRRMLSFGFTGVRFQRIRFRVELTSSDPTDSPLIAAMVLHFDKLPHDAGSWRIVIPLDNVDPEYERDAVTMADELDTLLTAEAGFTRLTIGSLDYRVRIAAAKATIFAGRAPGGVWELSAIEIRDEEDQPVAGDA